MQVLQIFDMSSGPDCNPLDFSRTQTLNSGLEACSSHFDFVPGPTSGLGMRNLPPLDSSNGLSIKVVGTGHLSKP